MDNVRPLRDRSAKPSRRTRLPWRWLLWAIVPLVVVALSLVNLWVDFMWFGELGQRSVLATRIQWGFAMGIGAGLLAFALIYLNLLLTLRVARNDLYVPFLNVPEAEAKPAAPEQPVIPGFVMRPIALGIAFVVAVFTGLAMGGRWETVLRWTGRSEFGIDDPQFGKDVAFYVFDIPLIELVLGFLQVMLVLTAIAVIVSYVAMGVIRYTPVLRVANAALVHLALLAAGFFLLQAVRFRIEIWNLVLSESGAARGVGYTDEHARIPGFWVLVVATVLLAAILVFGARSRRWKLPAYALGGWVALTVLATSIAPALVQSLIVAPTELKREEEVLKGNISMTRKAYDLDDMQDRRFVSDRALTAQEVKANPGTIGNVRLWSPDVLQSALSQLQTFRTYYSFRDVDVDRYEIDGQYRQTMIGAREIQPSQISGTVNWVNQRLQYTHGYGVAATYANEVDSEGLPELFIGDIPPETTTDLEIEQPAIYYGEEPDHYVIVNTEQEEFHYPDGDENVKTRYAGEGGVQISSPARRLALAARFGDPRIVLTGSITDESRLMFRRNIVERVHTLAPFLQLDQDPYLVIDGDRLVWVIDAYTTSDRFPFARAAIDEVPGSFNYIRNSVKVVVDAYHGDVTMYAIDEDDPVLKAWRAIFPSLFEDADEVPPRIEAHFRYPEDLFLVQSELWATYHMGDHEVFFNKEDQWQVPTVNGELLEPFYVLAKLPEGEKEELLLMRPMTPANRKNMIGWLAARMDPGHYGELVTYRLPKQQLTFGPEQIEARINQNSEISAQFTLWERQADVIRGNLLVFPVENSLLYVQPIYLQSRTTKLPEFRRVIVVLGNDVVWGNSLDEALQNLFEARAAGGDPDAAGGDPDTAGGDSDPAAGGVDGEAPADEDAGDDAADGDTSGTDGGQQPAGGDAPDDAELRRLVQEIGERYDSAIECQRRGDWECYGTETKRIGELLEQAGLDRRDDTRNRDAEADTG